MFRIELGKKIRAKLLKIFNKSNKRNNSLILLKEISSSPEEQLSAAEYLKNKNFINYAPYERLFDAELKSEVIDETANNDESIPDNIDQSEDISSNSEEIINSSDSFIKNSFNELYKTINDSEYADKEEIKEKVKELETELQKEEINESKIHQIMEWLKENAEEIRNIAIKIIADALSEIS